jgi:hypothetical protein
MWLFELFLLSLVCGTVVGFGIRAWDEMMEKRKKELMESVTPLVPESTDKTE